MVAIERQLGKWAEAERTVKEKGKAKYFGDYGGVEGRGVDFNFNVRHVHRIPASPPHLLFPLPSF